MDLLERAPFLDTLAEYADEACNGYGRLVLVSGESGVGKTALLEAFEERCKGTRWLWGACDGLLTPRPLGPLFDIGPQAGGELAGLCRRGATRDRLFAAFQAEISSPATFTVVAMEDLHWADEATIDLVSFLGRRLGRMPALVLVTYRDDELGEDHLLRVALGDLATQRATRRVRVPPLSAEAVRTLVGQRGVDAAELHRITDGNPFYVTEILEAGWPSVPPTVRDAVCARLARAVPATRCAVEAAAVIGSRVGRALLSAVLAGSGSSADDCLAAGIVVAEGNDFRFRHELARMAVEAGVAPDRKREVHAAVLAALEERGDADPAVLAHHAEGAGDDAAVLRHAPVAARCSSVLGAHREAAAQFERAMRCARDGDKVTRASLHEGLAGEYALLDRWEETEQELRAGLALRRELGDELRAGEDLRLLSTTLWRLCRGDESERAAEEAVRILELLPAGRELAWAYARLGASRWNRGRTDDGLGAIHMARDLGECLQLPDLESFGLHAIGITQARSGQDGIPLIERALRIAVDAALPEVVGNTYSSLQEAGVLLRRFADAERYFIAGMAYCEGRELGVYSLCLQGWRACALLLLGRWDDAAGISAEMLDRRGISPVNRLNPLRVLGSIRGRRGAPGTWELLDEALVLAEGTGEPQWMVPVRLARAEAYWLEGQPDSAEREADLADDVCAGRDARDGGALAAWLRRTGSRRAPRGELAEPYRLQMAGDWAEAARLWTGLGCPYDAALALGDATDETALRQALKIFASLGASPAVQLTRHKMRQLGIRSIPAGPRAATRSDPMGLTRREREVLGLICAGHTNAEIAAKLFISAKTVDHHVSAVLAKLDAPTRELAASHAARLGLAGAAEI